MEILLIRHAHAGDRLPGGRDRYRPLSPEGVEQAQALARALADRPVASVVASPASRCVQTIEPTAASKGLTVEEREEFWEGSDIDDVMVLLENMISTGYEQSAFTGDEPSSVVICSHGDIIPEVIERLAYAGVEINGRGCERASAWTLRHDGESWVSARYSNRRDLGLQ